MKRALKLLLTVAVYAVLFALALLGAVAVVRATGIPERHGMTIALAFAVVFFASAWGPIWSDGPAWRRRLLAFATSAAAGLGVLFVGEILTELLLALLDTSAVAGRGLAVSSKLLIGFAGAGVAVRVGRRILWARPSA